MTTPPNDSRGAGVVRISAFAAVVLALALATSSCRLDALSPARGLEASIALASVVPGTGVLAEAPVDSIHAMVPAITHLRADARGDTLHIRGQIRARSRGYLPYYGPGALGGWSMQVFLDTDPFHTAYWRGYDYVVRGVEWTPATNSFVTRRITLDPNTPGGWGPQSGVATFVQRPHDFEIAIPLGAVGGVQRDLGYCVETYATINCAVCNGGLTQEWADDYFAILHDTRGHHGELAGIVHKRAMGFAALLVPSPHHGAAAELRLASRIATDR